MDVFMRASNFQFRLYLQQLKDFHSGEIDTPERLFARVQSYYNDIQSKPGVSWLPVKKKKAVFTAQQEAKSPQASSSQKNSTTTSNSVIAASTKFVVDRTPPKDDEPSTRTNDKTGREEHWCAKCPKGGRWGNHLSDGHEKWFKEFLEAKKKKEESKTSGEPTPGGQAPESMTRASANVSAPAHSSLFRRTFVSFQDSDDESF